MAWLRQLAPDPIKVRIGTEARHEPGEPVAAPPGAQVAIQVHDGERVIGKRLWIGHCFKPTAARARCDPLRTGTFIEQNPASDLVQLLGPDARRGDGDGCGHLPKGSMTTKAYAAQTPPPLRGKQLAALRAIAATPGGLRLKAYRGAMPLLEAMGLVEMRAVSRAAHSEGRAWFLTPEGREAVKAYGVDEA